MKKIIAFLAIALMAITVGCKSIPSEDSLRTTSTAIGKAAGYVATQVEMGEHERAVVIEIMTVVPNVIPAKDHKYVDVWVPVANDILGKLVNEGKINKDQADLIINAFAVACKGMDYLVDVRFPKIRDYENLMNIATTGFADGFLTVFKPINLRLAAPMGDADYDREAYEFLMTSEAITK